MKRQMGLWANCGLLLLICMPIGTTAQTLKEIDTPPPPGKLVDVGGHKLHIHAMGRGRPTVVMECGAGDFSFDWSIVQPEVAHFTRACTYDRAGSAWSEPGPKPRTMQQIVYELHTGLHKAGIRGPYVLVGHSLGGLIVRVFAENYPSEVCGMVLVDSSHEDMQLFIQRPGDKEPKVVRFRTLSQGREVPAVQKSLPVSSASDAAKITESLPVPQKLEAPYDKLPADVQKVRLWAMSRPAWRDANDSEFDYLPEELARMYAARSSHPYPLGDIPLIVLTRGKGDYPEGGGLSPEQLDADRKRLQTDLTTLSRNSKQIIAEKSGHHIQTEDPELVVRAIREVVEAVRKKMRLVRTTDGDQNTK